MFLQVANKFNHETDIRMHLVITAIAASVACVDSAQLWSHMKRAHTDDKS